MVAYEVYFSGLVQGVFFRATTRSLANEIGLVGEVENLADGRVRALMCGEEIKIAGLIHTLHERFNILFIEKRPVSVPKTNVFVIKG